MAGTSAADIITSNVYSPFIDEGTNVVLTAPEGTAHQWRLDGVDIPGANNSQLNLNPVQQADEGTYTVAYDDGTGPQETDPFLLEVKSQGTVPVAGLTGLASLVALLALGGKSALKR